MNEQKFFLLNCSPGHHAVGRQVSVLEKIDWQEIAIQACFDRKQKYVRVLTGMKLPIPKEISELVIAEENLWEQRKKNQNAVLAKRAQETSNKELSILNHLFGPIIQ